MKFVARLLAVLWSLLATVSVAQAQGYPRSPINLVIPLAPGDAVDIAARTLSEELSRLLKVPIIAQNRPGAGSALGTDMVAKARKDGYTILITNNASLIVRRILDPATAPYDPFNDFLPLGMAFRTPTVLAVRSDSPFRNFADIIEFAKGNPGKVRLGTPGVGTMSDLSLQLVNSLAGTDITMVPFTGASPAVTALRGGHVEGILLALGAVGGQVKSGVLRGLAISSRFPELADIPPITELGYRQDLQGVWSGFFAPAGVSAEVASTLVTAVEKAVSAPDIAPKLLGLGMVREYVAPGPLRDRMREEYRLIDGLVKKSGLGK